MKEDNLNNIGEKKYAVMAWMICALGAIYYSYEYLLRITPSVMESALRTHFNLSAAGFGLLSAFYYYAYVPLQIPVGILLDRYGPRILITLACLICVIGTFMFSATSIFWIAALGRFLVGFGSAFAFVGILKLSTIWLPEDKLGMVAGLASALGTVGAMIGDNLMSELVVHFGWYYTVNFSACIGIILTVILWFGIRDNKKSEDKINITHDFKKIIQDLLIIIRNKQIWINGAIGCLIYLPTTVFAELWGIPYLEHVHDLSKESAGFANSLIFFGFMLGAPLMGFISDKLKCRKLPLLFGAVFAAIVMLVIFYVPDLSELQIYILLFILGLFYSSQCIVFAIGRELSPIAAAGTAIAVTNMLVMLGAVFLQPLVGNLLDFSLSVHINGIDLAKIPVDTLQTLYTSADYKFALSIVPFGIIISAILTFFLKETHADTIH